MVSRKYASDYRLENVEGKDGKTKTIAVYRGDLFDWVVSKEEVEKIKRIFIFSTIIEWVLLLISLSLNTDKGRVAYVSLPLIAVAFPLLGQTDCLFVLRKAEKGVERKDKDKVSEKLVSYVFVTLFLSSCSAIGHVISWLTSGESILDALLLITTVLLIGLSWNLFSKRNKLQMKKSSSTKVDE